ESAGEVIQADETHGHVVEGNREFFGVAVREQAAVGVFVVSESGLKLVLTVVNIADIVFEACKAPLIAEYDTGLNQRGEGSRGALVVLQFGKLPQRGFIEGDRFLVVAGGGDHVGLGAVTLAEKVGSRETLRDRELGFGDGQS